MGLGYHRGEIQKQNDYYKCRNHEDSYAAIGVTAFRNSHGEPIPENLD